MSRLSRSGSGRTSKRKKRVSKKKADGEEAAGDDDELDEAKEPEAKDKEAEAAEAEAAEAETKEAEAKEAEAKAGDAKEGDDAPRKKSSTSKKAIRKSGQMQALADDSFVDAEEDEAVAASSVANFVKRRLLSDIDITAEQLVRLVEGVGTKSVTGGQSAAATICTFG